MTTPYKKEVEEELKKIEKAIDDYDKLHGTPPDREHQDPEVIPPHIRIEIKRSEKPLTYMEDCPECGSYLVVRHNKRTGRRFIGCQTFPKCTLIAREESLAKTQKRV